jgi:hypothetical protein
LNLVLLIYRFTYWSHGYLEAAMEAINKAVYSKPYEDEKLMASRSIRLLLVITGLATGGATNVVLDIAR